MDSVILVHVRKGFLNNNAMNRSNHLARIVCQDFLRTTLALLDRGRLGVEFLSAGRRWFMAQRETWELSIRDLGRFQDRNGQRWTEFLRVVGLPDILQSNKDASPPEISSTEIPDILPSHSHEVQGFDVLAISYPAMENIFDLGTHVETYSEPQWNVDSCLQSFPSNNLHYSKAMTTSVSNGVLNSKTVNFSQGIDSSAVVTNNTSAISLIDIRPGSKKTWQWCVDSLAMTSPTPVADPTNVLLPWTAVEPDEVQEGPIPDLEDYIDSSLWDHENGLSQLDWNSVPLLEQNNAVEPTSE